VLVEWVAASALLFAVCGGLGLGVARLAGRLPGALVPACGLAAAAIVGGILADVAHALIVPVLAALAAAGAVAGHRRLRGVDLAAAAAALGALALYTAPFVLAGEATFAGYIKLDDTATWLAITDRIMDAGPNTDGLAPSTYEAVLAANFGNGYPVGGFAPLGFASRALGTDPAWLFQPYMAVMGAILALALWELARFAVPARAVRSVVAVGASCSALLVGYYLWGGIKELLTAALFAALTAAAVRVPRDDVRALTGPAVAAAGLVAVGGAGALAWALPGVAILVARGVRSGGEARGPASLALLAIAGAGALVAALLLTGASLSPFRGSFTNQDDLGNLAEPLEPAQLAGIWPALDFRFDPDSDWLAYGLIALAVGAAAFGLVRALKRGDAGLATLVIGAAAVCAAVAVLASPWLDAKALAIASPAVLLAALTGATQLPPPAASRVACTAALLAGVAWSLVTQWGGASLAPRDQLAELEVIGERLEGGGPTLITEYQPYGARHFLRDADPEGASELRRRLVPLRDGTTADKGEWVDTDDLSLAALAPYRAVVLRRSPEQSRPPGDFARTWTGEHYEVWERDPMRRRPVRHLALGEARSPVGTPRCPQVMRLARAVGPDGTLTAAVAPEATAVFDPGGGHWTSSGRDLEVWLGGSVRGSATLTLDGEVVARRRHMLNNDGGYTSFGLLDPDPGRHELRIELGGADLHPGSAPHGSQPGRIVLRRPPSPDALRAVPAPDARALCRGQWDWIEALRPA
jgi:hypothetical protein